MTPWEGSSGHQYWLSDEQPLQLQIYWMLGALFEAAAELRVHIFLDGVALPVDGAGGTEAVVPFVEGLAEHSVTIPADRFPEGLSVLHVHDRVDTGRLTFGYGGVFASFAAFRSTTELLTSFEDSTGYTLEAAEPRLQTSAWYDGFGGVSFTYVTFPPEDGVYRFTLNVQAHPFLYDCPDLTDTVAIVALLDGHPVDIAPYGRQVVATLGARERRAFRVEIRDLPIDGVRHHLDVLQLSGLGHPAQDLFGCPTPWSSSFWYGVAQAEWE